jgi:hypothetical protein
LARQQKSLPIPVLYRFTAGQAKKQVELARPFMFVLSQLSNFENYTIKARTKIKTGYDFHFL